MDDSKLSAQTNMVTCPFLHTDKSTKAPLQTDSMGHPISDDQFSLTAGSRGPLLMQDVSYFDKISHFNRERIPERVVYSKGAGAFGYFEVTKDISKYCKARIFDKVGKRTPMFVRFSQSVGEKGSADTERDVRGFAMKYYTEDGIWDLVGNNSPVFFIRDPIKYPDLIHALKRDPKTNIRDPNTFWDFMSLTPESLHHLIYTYTSRGTPRSYRNMNGYGTNTYKMVNDKNQAFYIKFHIQSDEGCKNMTTLEAKELLKDPDYLMRDLFLSIEKGNYPSWTMRIQVMPEQDAEKYKWDITDCTKCWCHSDYPLMEVGKIILNRNPENYFAEVEQSGFSVSNMIPGIEPSEDRVLQGRMIAYIDALRHRLGTNYHQIPVNCPFKATISNGMRDGSMVVDGNQGSMLNYFPNSFSTYAPNMKYQPSSFNVSGLVKRHPFKHDESDFIQPGWLYRKVLSEEERTHLIFNIVEHLGLCREEIQTRMAKLFYKCDQEFGQRIADALKLKVDFSKKPEEVCFEMQGEREHDKKGEAASFMAGLKQLPAYQGEESGLKKGMMTEFVEKVKGLGM